MDEARVVVTGMGAITPIGIGIDAFWDGLRQGRSGAGRIQRFDPSDFPSQIGAEVHDFEPERYIDGRDLRKMDRFTRFAVAAVTMALENAGFEPDDFEEDRLGRRAGVTMGTGIGGLETLVDQYEVLQDRGPRRVSPFFIPMMIANMAASQVAMQFGLRGPNTTAVTACASSANAVGEAMRMLQRREADVMISGGSEAAFVPISIAGFSAMRALSTRNDEPRRASRPFDADRDGFLMGEGCGVVVLETLAHARSRGADIQAEVLGYGMTADAHHVTAPAPDGEGEARAMRRALDDAGLAPAEVDYINAHATSTPVGDTAETKAVRDAFGAAADELPVSSTKSMTGHLMGAAGAVEMIAAILAIHHQVLPPTINYETLDPECDLDYVPNEAREASVDVALSNSFGFGGQNASLIVGRGP